MGVFGVIVTWYRMSGIADALAHSMLLGGALSAWFGIDLTCVCFVLALLFAVLMKLLSHQSLEENLIIYLLMSASVGLAIALQRENLGILINGEVLLINQKDFVWLVIVSSCALAWLLYNRSNLILMAFNREIAMLMGVNVTRLGLMKCLILASVISVDVKVTGPLLMGTSLIMPAMIARLLSKSPTQMMVTSACVGGVVAMVGFVCSMAVDVPPCTAIALLYCVGYVGVHVTKRLYAH